MLWERLTQAGALLDGQLESPQVPSDFRPDCRCPAARPAVGNSGVLRVPAPSRARRNRAGCAAAMCAVNGTLPRAWEPAHGTS